MATQDELGTEQELADHREAWSLATELIENDNNPNVDYFARSRLMQRVVDLIEWGLPREREAKAQPPSESGEGE